MHGAKEIICISNSSNRHIYLVKILFGVLFSWFIRSFSLILTKLMHLIRWL